MKHKPPVCCTVPTHLLQQLAQAIDPGVSRRALDALGFSARARALRAELGTLPPLPTIAAPNGGRFREVYDARHGGPRTLPGRLMRSERDHPVRDQSVNEAYVNAGHAYAFYRAVFGRNSLDDRAMVLRSSVHLSRKLNNAFWDGSQMVYGDGDGEIFVHLPRPLEVVAHELTHGVIAHTSGLVYRGEAGALNESFADVMGSLVKQWHHRQTARRADWLIGRQMMGPALRARALRTLTGRKAFEGDPLLGTDPQPKHYRDRIRIPDPDVAAHLNSGIPNHAFYLVATRLGGYAWTRAGAIWYEAMTTLPSRCNFATAAGRTIAIARRRFGSPVAAVVGRAWRDVGV
ncbi:MAG TPA: M4 family metallopeptidase [Gemmatimonadales bacterium]|nr:M4 family metallopeptidase [Gemmatimonadales bacterium]